MTRSLRRLRKLRNLWAARLFRTLRKVRRSYFIFLEAWNIFYSSQRDPDSCRCVWCRWLSHRYWCSSCPWSSEDYGSQRSQSRCRPFLLAIISEQWQELSQLSPMLVSAIGFLQASVVMLQLIWFSKKSPQHPVSLVAEVTTLRRHMQSIHKVCQLKCWSV